LLAQLRPQCPPLLQFMEACGTRPAPGFGFIRTDERVGNGFADQKQEQNQRQQPNRDRKKRTTPELPTAPACSHRLSANAVPISRAFSTLSAFDRASAARCLDAALSSRARYTALLATSPACPRRQRWWRRRRPEAAYPRTKKTPVRERERERD